MKKKKKNQQQQQPKIKKKKKKKENASVDRKGAESENFLGEMALWFSAHQQQIDGLFADGPESVDLKDFQLGLLTLGVPLLPQQLLPLLQNADGTVSYRDLSRRAQTLSSEPQTLLSEDSNRPDDVSRPEKQPNIDKQRFVRLNVRLLPFDSSASHPGNFQVSLPSGCRVFRLMEAIGGRVGTPTSGLRVFRSRVPGQDVPLPPGGSLEECGFEGGPPESPPEATVYYDYRLLFTDCPILNCDHYFSSELQKGGGGATMAGIYTVKDPNLN